jgi:membrane-associated phospholipid phosphatase
LATWPATIARSVWVSPGHLARRSKAAQGDHRRLLMSLQILYCVLLGAWLLHEGNWPTPDQIAIAMFAFAVLMSRGVSFLRDWSPFIILLLSYEALRGVADGLVANTHVQFAVNADKFMFFGHVPTLYLQDKLWDPDHLHWYDYVAAFVHPMHFILPLALAFVFWMSNRRLYWKFLASYLLLTYAGFITYLLFPAAPPWYAADVGRIAPVQQILGQVLWQHSVSHPIVLAYGYFDPNPVAAIPSLHAAFPVLVWLVLWKVQPKWGWATIFYPLAMAFSVVYLGEHYVIDVLIGWLYGFVAFAVIWIVPERSAAWRHWLARSRVVFPLPVPEKERAPSSGGVAAVSVQRRDLLAQPADAPQSVARNHRLGFIQEDRPFATSATDKRAWVGGGFGFGASGTRPVPGDCQWRPSRTNPASADESAMETSDITGDKHGVVPPE